MKSYEDFTCEEARAYREGRKEYVDYRFLKGLLRILSEENDVIYDVGSGSIDMLSYLPCKKKVSIDIAYPYSGNGVIGIKGDFLQIDIETPDIYTCFQVMEHIDDHRIKSFAKKLLSARRYTVISVPYMEPEGFCEYHLQALVGEKKVTEWFGNKPRYMQVIKEYDGSYRLVCVFVNAIVKDDDIKRQFGELSAQYDECMDVPENEPSEEKIS